MLQEIESQAISGTLCGPGGQSTFHSLVVDKWILSWEARTCPAIGFSWSHLCLNPLALRPRVRSSKEFYRWALHALFLLHPLWPNNTSLSFDYGFHGSLCCPVNTYSLRNFHSQLITYVRILYAPVVSVTRILTHPVNGFYRCIMDRIVFVFYVTSCFFVSNSSF